MSDDRGGNALCFMAVASPPLGGVFDSLMSSSDPCDSLKDCSNGLGSRSNLDLAMDMGLAGGRSG